jgi:hypothetical protein
MFWSGDVWAWLEPARTLDTHPEAATLSPPIFKKWRRVIMVSLLFLSSHRAYFFFEDG